MRTERQVPGSPHSRRPTALAIPAFAILAMACAGVGTAGSSAAPIGSAQPPILFGMCADGRFGFIDRSGAVVVPPKYAYAEPFEGDFAKIAVAVPPVPGKEDRGGPPRMRGGFLDRKGRVAVEPIYDNARAFSEGLAAAERDGKWGYVDARGAVRIPFQYEHAHAFSEGLALVRAATGQRFIDTSGRTVLDVSRLRWRREGKELPLVASAQFSEGLALFNIVVHGEDPDVLFGYMDRTGRIVIEPAFTYAYGFHGGYAKVRGSCDRNIVRRCEGIIDRTGARVIPLEHEFLAYFDGGLANFSRVVGKEHLVGFLNTRNEVAIEPRFELACMEFREGLCHTLRKKRWAYIDRSGAEVLVLPADTQHADQFSEGLAMVRTARGTHFIRRDGTMAFEGTLKDASRFRDGLAYVQFVDGGWGYVDREGRVVYRQQEPC